MKKGFGTAAYLLFSAAVIACAVLTTPALVSLREYRQGESTVGTPVYSDEITVTAFLEEGAVNINTASVEELCQLPGIGPTLAQRIVERRLLDGPYEDLWELERLEGIGEQTVRGLLDYACT
ncbi:ComEA family DNA-binding protein [Angelakisella massiliensis]|uniref:ComEA family DNA-binding protein n=1 Tax=Angelakisella massiliensis TaxID=1871018 RepID=UPI0008F94F80|nr:helix-hairpin-helix domain-containing protein [Angelakisella massiliensis]